MDIDPVIGESVVEPKTELGIQVGIPWRPHSSRLKAFESVTSWYESNGFEVIAAEAPGRERGAFNLSAARNHLVRDRMTSRVMVLSDADTLPELPALLEAIKGAAVDGLVHLPYHLYRDEGGTYVEGATSGIFVFTRAAWESTNGQDEHFEGWGYEDSAWRLAHLTLNGPIPRHRGIAVASIHALSSRDRVSLNRKRYLLYQQAYGDADRMRTLVRGGTAPLSTHNARTAQARARIAERRSGRYGTRPLGS